MKQLDQLRRATVVRAPDKPKRGRPPFPDAVRQLKDVGRCAARLTQVAPSSFTGLTPTEVAILREEAARLQWSITSWLGQLAAALAQVAD